MKQTKWFLGALSLLTLAGCSNDIEVDNTPGVAEKDEMRYIKIAINGDMGSRAGETETGTENKFSDGVAGENTVNRITLRFFDKDGNFIVQPDPQNVTEDEELSSTDNNINKKIVKVVGFEVKKGQNLPSYVLCFVNSGVLPDKSLNMREYRNEPIKYYKDGDYFTMTNSCYYGVDAVTGGTEKVKISGTPIKPSQIFASEADAKKEIENTTNENEDNIVDIYVERNAVKVIFSLATDAVAEGASYDGYTLKFKPDKWTINADEDENYVLKKFADAGGKIPDFNTLDNGDFSTWKLWNDEANHRSYWACSPGYYSTNFPQVSSDVINNASAAGDKKYSLKYYSYNEIMGIGNDRTPQGQDIPTGENTSNFKYTFENTVGKDAFSSMNPNACCPSLLIVGKYDIFKGDSKIEFGADNAFYTKEDKLYFKDAPAKMTDAPLMIDHFIESQTLLYVKENGKEVLLNEAQEATKTALKANLIVEHPSVTNTNSTNVSTKVPERYVTLQISSTPSGNNTLYYKTIGSDKLTEVTSTNRAEVNELLWANVGVAEAYTSGMAYFSIPIRHLRASEDSGTKYGANQEIPWGEARVGDFGLVRNHVYEIGVSKIKNLGTGILDADDPIVPPTKADKYAIKYNLNILNWRVVPKQIDIEL